MSEKELIASGMMGVRDPHHLEQLCIDHLCSILDGDESCTERVCLPILDKILQRHNYVESRALYRDLDSYGFVRGDDAPTGELYFVLEDKVAFSNRVAGLYQEVLLVPMEDLPRHLSDPDKLRTAIALARLQAGI